MSHQHPITAVVNKNFAELKRDPMKYNLFHIPETITEETQQVTGDTAIMRGKFVCKPFDPGFAHTIGNTLRRILLNSIEAPAIIGVYLSGVLHKFAAIDGVVEDMMQIVLNLKTLKIRAKTTSDEKEFTISTVLDITEAMLKEHNGQFPVTAKMLIASDAFEAVDSDRVLFSVTAAQRRECTLRIRVGRGYVPADRLGGKAHQQEILVDAIYSPVTLANYYVEATRVGQDTNYDQLILELETDGRVSPSDALSYASQIAVLHFNVFRELKASRVIAQNDPLTHDDREITVLDKLALQIQDIEFSVRSLNCLLRAGIVYLGEIVVMSEEELKQLPNFGKKSLQEVEEKLAELELSLQMDLQEHGITAENIPNIKEILANHHNNR